MLVRTLDITQLPRRKLAPRANRRAHLAEDVDQVLLERLGLNRSHLSPSRRRLGMQSPNTCKL